MNRTVRIVAATAVSGGVIALADQLRATPNPLEMVTSLMLIGLGMASLFIARGAA